MKNNDALDALDRLENDALSSRDGYGDTRKDAEMIRNFINTRPQPSGDAVMALDKVLKHYNNKIQYLESIKRTEFGNDMLHTYKKFIGELEPVNAALTQPKAEKLLHTFVEFGTGKLCVVTGLFENKDCVVIEPAKKQGEVGQYIAEEDRNPLDRLIEPSVVMLFPTEEQAKMVADALCNVKQTPKADVEGLKKDTSNTQELLAKCEDFTVGYNNGWNAAIDSLAAQGYIGVPEGYAIVPIEPTDAMCIAGCKAVYGGEVSIMDANDKAIEYKAMLKAAPKKEV